MIERFMMELRDLVWHFLHEYMTKRSASILRSACFRVASSDAICHLMWPHSLGLAKTDKRDFWRKPGQLFFLREQQTCGVHETYIYSTATRLCYLLSKGQTNASAVGFLPCCRRSCTRSACVDHIKTRNQNRRRLTRPRTAGSTRHGFSSTRRR